MRRGGLLLLLALLAGPAPARAATIGLQTSPDRLTADARDVTYAVSVTAGPSDENVVLDSPMALTLDGPAEITLTSIAAGALAAPRCPGGSLPPHASAGPFNVSQWSYSLRLPANTTSVLSGQRHLRPVPWARDIASDLGAQFTLKTGPAGTTIAMLTAPIPRYDGLRGVRMVLHAAAPIVSGRARVRAGSSLLLSARVFAPLAGDRITLVARGPSPAHPHVIARPTVTNDRTIRYRWRPRGPGQYVISAVYDKPRAGYVRDRTDCPLVVQVRK
jgi:hypothetical protein